MATFASRLKELRKTKGKTQKQMAEFLGLNERTFRQYEAGEVDPPSSKATKLAEYFGVSVDYLLGRTNYWIDADGHITVKTYNEILNMDIDELKGLIDNGTGEGE